MSKELQKTFEGHVTGTIVILSFIVIFQFIFISIQSHHIASTPRCDLFVTEKQVNEVRP